MTLGYELLLMLYEKGRRTWYEWSLDLPNPTSNDPDAGGEPENIGPRGKAEDQEAEA